MAHAGSSLLAAAARTVARYVDLQLTLTEAALREAAPLARGRLLDVGCGHRPYDALFAPYVTEHVGVEHEAVFASTDAARHTPGPDVLYDGVTLPFADASFDTVLCVQVLEHTPRPARLLSEIARVLRPDGVLLAQAPFSFRLHEEPHDYFRYSPYGLRLLCEDAALAVERVTPLGTFHSLMGHKACSYLALRVGRLQGVGQQLGKLAHEAPTAVRPRWWALPAVGAALLGVATVARVLDRLAPDPSETLGYMLVARRLVPDPRAGGVPRG